jgi:PEP-CTERM motif
MKRTIVCCALLASLLGQTIARAGIVYSTYADQATFNGSPALQTTTTPQASATVNQQVNAGTSLTQTIVTGASGFQLDALDIYSGGKGGGNATLNIYPNPVGGGDSDGFVNTSFSTDLLNGGNGLAFTFFGSPGTQYIHLDLTGADEITLAPNTKYAIEFDVTNGQFSWQRSSAGTYPNGNLYQGASELNFNGTPPAGGRGERDQVGGTPQRDAGLALFAAPEPASAALFGLGLIAFVGSVRRRFSV